MIKFCHYIELDKPDGQFGEYSIGYLPCGSDLFTRAVRQDQVGGLKIFLLQPHMYPVSVLSVQSQEKIAEDKQIMRVLID